jgi:NAD(P)-dependent dehydrogenase (short-subunit alcohol dehydrogenase family)
LNGQLEKAKSMDQFRLDGKAALITGGNRGIGLAIARLFGEAGAKCMLTARQQTAEVNELVAQSPNCFAFIRADATDPEAPGHLVSATVETFGRLDILVNYAGISAVGDVDKFDDETLERIFSTNVTSCFRFARSALKRMCEQGAGVILNVGSVSGVISNIPQNQAAYNSSKAAVHMLTKSIASEYADRNIRANAIAPGYIKTDMTKGGIENPEWDPIWRQMTPIGRYGEAEEVANCALFLCSPASSYVTGAVLLVDGGYTTR